MVLANEPVTTPTGVATGFFLAHRVSIAAQNYGHHPSEPVFARVLRARFC